MKNIGDEMKAFRVSKRAPMAITTRGTCLNKIRNKRDAGDVNAWHARVVCTCMGITDGVHTYGVNSSGYKRGVPGWCRCVACLRMS